MTRLAAASITRDLVVLVVGRFVDCSGRQGEYAISSGFLPTGIVATCLSFAVLTTKTSLPLKLVNRQNGYRRARWAMPCGVSPTWISVTFWLLAAIEHRDRGWDMLVGGRK